MKETIKEITYLLLLVIMCSVQVSYLLDINTILCIRYILSGFLISILITYIVVKMVGLFEEWRDDDVQYKIERNFKTDEVINDIVFNKESFDKSMMNFIKNNGLLLKPFDINKNDESVAKIIDFDDEYLYLSEIKDKNIINNLSKYKCQFYTSTNNIVTNENVKIFYINNIKKIRIMKNVEED